MNRRQKIIVSVVGIFIVLLALVGLTYAYFLTRIRGNNADKSISVTTANLSLVYGDGSPSILTSADPIYPDSDNPIGSKTFTVTNDGDQTVDDYGVYLEDFKVMYAADATYDSGSVSAGDPATLAYPDDFKFVITCESSKSGKTCNGFDGTLPNKAQLLIQNSIDKDEVQTFTMTLTYLETNTDQSADMNKTIEGKIQIYDQRNVVDIEGTVASASAGDYVQINSVEKKSQIVNGKYRLTSVEPGTHTLSVRMKDGTLRGSSKITINKGKNSGVSGSTITIGDTAQAAVINITKIASTLTVSIASNLNVVNPYKEGTLPYELLNNTNVAKNDVTPTFNKAENTSKGMFSAKDDYGTSWYYRGMQTNNYVSFANFTWRVVRINGDGSVRLILNAVLDNPVHCLNSSVCTTSSFNTSSDDNAYVGYMYGSDYGYEAVYGYEISSSIKQKVNSFYTTYLNSYSSYLADAIFCGDKSDGYGGAIYDDGGYYGGYRRLYNSSTATPTLKCIFGSESYPSHTHGDYARYTSNELTYPIGLLSADELVMAGGYKNSSMSGNYLNLGTYYWYYDDEGELLYGNTVNDWWTMTPVEYSSSNGAKVFSAGTKGLTSSKVTDAKGVRPVINIKSTVKVSSGAGTNSNPYKLKLS